MASTTTRRRVAIVLGIVAIATAGIIPAGASTSTEGSLDPSFGSGGSVMNDFAGSTDVARGVAIQPDGKIVAAGVANDGTRFNFAIARYDSDGSLDSTFGPAHTGEVITDLGARAEANAVAIEPDGKIVLAGFRDSGSTGFDVAVARYKSNGALDTTFGPAHNGEVITDIGGSADQANAIAIQSDGQIVVGGYSDNGIDDDFAVVRYNADGSLDTSFSGDGKATTDFGGGEDHAQAVGIQPDGFIVAVGYREYNTDVFAVVRYDPFGNLDGTFSGDGKTTTAVAGKPAIANAVAIAPDGKVIAAGWTGIGNSSDFARSVRYRPNGSLDNTFDHDGRVTTDVAGSNDAGHAVAVQPNGRIVVAGDAYGGGGSTFDFAAVRYNASGNLDGAFDGDGKSVTSLASNIDVANAVAIEPDGKIIAAGDAYNAGTYDFAVARYIGDATPPFSAHLIGLPANTTTLKQTLQWTASDDNTGVKTFDVRTRGAAYSETNYGTFSTFRSATPLTAGPYVGSPGNTICFDVRARDVAGNLGAYGPDGCIAYPVDDPTTTASGTWTTSVDARFYGGSARTSSTAGATLSLPVNYRHLGIVVEKCNGCGTVTVSLGATLLATIDTDAAATTYRVVVPLDASAAVKTGTLTITQASAGEPVYIDGIANSLN